MRMKWLAVLGLMLSLGGLGGLTVSHWSGLTIPAMIWPFGTLGSTAVPQDEAVWQGYANGLKYLKSRSFSEASQTLESLEAQAGGLTPLVRLRLAEAYAGLGDESKVQSILQSILWQSPQLELKRLAHYRLGQSYLRSGEREKARENFQSLLTPTAPDDLSLAAHYFLGGFSEDNERALVHYRTYIRDVQDGMYSIPAADAMKSMSAMLSAPDRKAMAQAYLMAKAYSPARDVLQPAPINDVWLERAQAELGLKHLPEARAALVSGIPSETLEDRVQSGVDLLLKLTPPAQQKITLYTLLKPQPTVASGYLLWQLRKRTSGAEQQQLGERLIHAYPNSLWAPETSWELAWPLYESGQGDAFLSRVAYHLKTFPYSRSAARLLYWQARYKANHGQFAAAEADYKTLVEKYPYQYYAFRAQQRLDGVAHPWRTQPGRSYPPAFDQEGHWQTLLNSALSHDLVPLSIALLDHGRAEDVRLLLQGRVATHQMPVTLRALLEQQAGRYALSLRLVRDAMDKARLAGKSWDDPEAYYLLYPLLYAPEIAEKAPTKGLDPFLVQALMRQESYFNAQAVSSSNALGLMQLLPSTAAGQAKLEGIPGFSAAQLFNPSVNIQLGCGYLRYLHERFNGNSMPSVGGYNGGPNAMARWIAASGGRFESDPDLFIESIPYAQTRDYIKEVFSHFWNYQHWYATTE